MPVARQRPNELLLKSPSTGRGPACAGGQRAPSNIQNFIGGDGGSAATYALPGSHRVIGRVGGILVVEAEAAVVHVPARARFLDVVPGAVQVELVLEVCHRYAGDGEGPGVRAGLDHRVVLRRPVGRRRDAGAEHVVVAGQIDGAAARGARWHGHVDDRSGVAAGAGAGPVGHGVVDRAAVDVHAPVAHRGAAGVHLGVVPVAAQIVLVGQGSAGGGVDGRRPGVRVDPGHGNAVGRPVGLAEAERGQVAVQVHGAG